MQQRREEPQCSLPVGIRRIDEKYETNNSEKVPQVIRTGIGGALEMRVQAKLLYVPTFLSYPAPHFTGHLRGPIHDYARGFLALVLSH
jgi:hypothetical protein